MISVFFESSPEINDVPEAGKRENVIDFHFEKAVEKEEPEDFRPTSANSSSSPQKNSGEGEKKNQNQKSNI